MKIGRYLKDCLTEADNETGSLKGLLLFSAIVSYIFLSLLDVLFTQDFEYTHFGIGLATIIGAGNIDIKIGSKRDEA